MYNTIVIGAGQAGLSIGYYLKQLNQKFILIDKGSEVGESWKARYDSLVLFTPRIYSSLPGMNLEGEEQGFPTKDEIVTYFKKYVDEFNIPIQFNAEVVSLSKENGHFLLKTKVNEYHARNIVIATGSFQTPNIPSFSKHISKNIRQLHSTHYQNPNQLADGKVLVVGGGNSGAQIAVELSKERETYLASSKKLKFLPLSVGNKSIFWWFDKLGLLSVKNSSLLGKWLQQKGDPIFGFELKRAIKNNNVIIKNRVVDGKLNQIIFEDSTDLQVCNIIWATGFRTNFPWLKINDVITEKGMVVHNRGVTNVCGLYFIGLPWQYRRGSGLLQGVGYDAEYIVRQIENSSE